MSRRQSVPFLSAGSFRLIHPRILLFLFIPLYSLFSQTGWIRQPGPVLAMDTTLMWASYGQPACILHQDTFKMWYAVASGKNPSDAVPRGRIHTAWSLDGSVWNKSPQNPVLDVGGAGTWDGEWLDTPEILWDDEGFKLYYYGDSTYFQGQDNTALGLATSADGIHWEKQGVVLRKGTAEAWDGKFIESPAALYDRRSGRYTLLYNGIDAAGWVQAGLAFSSDGFHWDKAEENPVLSPGESGRWDDLFLAVPSVIRSGKVYEMWYSGVSFKNQWDSVPVGYAVSLNARDWIKYPGNPVLDLNPGETGGFWAVDVVWDPQRQKYLMYYETEYRWDAQAIYLAESPRNILFSQSCACSGSDDVMIQSGQSVQLEASGGELYQWAPSEGLDRTDIADPLASPVRTTVYRVLIVSETGIGLDSVTVTVEPTAVHAAASEPGKITVFPNPFRESALLTVESGQSRLYSLTLYNILGQQVAETKTFDSDRCLIEGSPLASGLYIFQLSDRKQVIHTGKLFVY
jgi:sucrose-6-phosphate hydrolase SacC (GH32 family)